MKSSAFDNFSEKALEALDFARCQRADGTFYGTSGQCRKGSPAGAKEQKAKAAKRDPSKDIKRGGTVIGTSPRNMLVDNIKTLEDRLKDSRSEGETKLLKDSISKAKDKLAKEDAAAKPKAPDSKQLRKDMISARDNEKKLKEARTKAEAGDDKKAAAAARRAHIDSKNEMKAAAQRFKDSQTANNDMRRFGRQEERDKASIKQLQEALKSGQLSPTKERSVRMDISRRQARNKARKDIKKLG